MVENNIKNYYEKISAKYLEKVGKKVFGEIPYDLLEIKKYIKNNSSILEIGSGTGRIGIYLLTMFNIKSYIGLEANIKFTKEFEKKISIYKDFITSDYKIENETFLNYKTRNKFDIILLPFSVIMEFNKYEALFKRIKLLLNKKGFCIIETINNEESISTVDLSKVKINNFYIDDYKNYLSEIGLEYTKTQYISPFGKSYKREIIILNKII